VIDSFQLTKYWFLKQKITYSNLFWNLFAVLMVYLTA
jgi:hypothetical protein